jgi:hypothetical protein
VKILKTVECFPHKDLHLKWQMKFTDQTVSYDGPTDNYL